MRAFGSDDVRDAAHERMVALRIDIAGRLALERAERDLRLEAASASTTTACSRGGDARDDDAPATPTVTGGRARRPEAHVSARIPPGPAREQLKLQWVKLFHLAERFPRAAVTSRLAAVHALHDRTQAAIIAHRAAEEDAAAVLHDALDALVSSDHRVPDETHPTSDTSDKHRVAAVPSSTNRVAGSDPSTNRVPESDRRGGSRARHQTRSVRTQRHALVSGGGGTLRGARGGADGVRGERIAASRLVPARGERARTTRENHRPARSARLRGGDEQNRETRQGEPPDGRRGAERRRRETSSGEAEGQQE